MNEKEILTAGLDAVTKSIEMWSWLYQHPAYSKTDYFEYKNIAYENRPLNNCCLCEFVREFSNYSIVAYFGIDALLQNHSISNCRYCPVTWPEGSCCSTSSPFDRWARALCEADDKQAAGDVLKLLYKSKRRLREAINLAAEDERREREKIWEYAAANFLN